MANEHTLLTRKTLPVTRECADATTITKGTLLSWAAGGNTVIAHAGTAARERVAGIAYTDKIADTGDGVIAVLCGPGDEFRAVASGSISRGDPVGAATSAGGAFPNYIASLSGSLSLSGSVILGYATSDATAGQTLRYVLDIQTPAYSAS